MNELFVYCRLAYPDFQSKVLGGSRKCTPTWLYGYRRKPSADGSLNGIEPFEEGIVSGLILKLEEGDEEKLEGFFRETGIKLKKIKVGEFKKRPDGKPNIDDRMEVFAYMPD